MLWASTGENGRTRPRPGPDSLGGKILRMTPDGGPAPGNPFGTLVWTYGHRNVQGMAWDGAGRMFATEFGQNRFDEINRIQPGGNYGWPVVEGAGGEGRYTDPGAHLATDQASPSGAAIAAGSLWVAALRGERLWQVPLDRSGALGMPVARFTGEYGRLREVVRAPGRLSVVVRLSRPVRPREPRTGRRYMDPRRYPPALADPAQVRSNRQRPSRWPHHAARAGRS